MMDEWLNIIFQETLPRHKHKHGQYGLQATLMNMYLVTFWLPRGNRKPEIESIMVNIERISISILLVTLGKK